MFNCSLTKKSARIVPVATSTILCVLLCIALLSYPANAAPQTGSRQLNGHIPAVVATARLKGHLVSSTTISLAFSLPLRDPQGLQSLLQHLYDPKDPAYGKFLTPAEIFGSVWPHPKRL